MRVAGGFGMPRFVVLYYPKIQDTRGCPGGPCIAFDKIDGTNVHFDWHSDFGFHAFGTRRDVFNLDEAGIARFEATHPGLDGTTSPFLELADRLDAHLRRALAPGAHEAVVFCEIFAEGSFAGEHPAGVRKEVVLFDVTIDGKIVPPDVFVTDYAAFPQPAVVYRGKFLGQLVEDVRRGFFGVAEGVVIKGVKAPWMAKVKTDAYLARLKAAHGVRWVDYWET